MAKTSKLRNFEQRFGCTAPKRWSKYTTLSNCMTTANEDGIFCCEVNQPSIKVQGHSALILILAFLQTMIDTDVKKFQACTNIAFLFDV